MKGLDLGTGTGTLALGLAARGLRVVGGVAEATGMPGCYLPRPRSVASGPRTSVPFEHEEWRGRIRACNGVGAALDHAQVDAFDRELTAMLATEWALIAPPPPVRAHRWHE